MPEGDVVWRTARSLDRALSGHVLVRSDFRVPALATVDLAGGTVVETVSRGKHLLTRIDHQDRSWTLHTHLKMEGSWQVYSSGERWRRPAYQARVVLGVAGREAGGFSLGIVELVARAEEDRVVGHLGPDLLGPDWDEDEAVRRLASDPQRPVHEALLDQRNLAGLGTIYVAEVCFLQGVHPDTPVGAVADLPRLVRRAQQLLTHGARGSQPVTTGDRRRGQTLWVYGRDRHPCRRCGALIEAGQRGDPGRERAAYWCPRCQPPR